MGMQDVCSLSPDEAEQGQQVAHIKCGREWKHNSRLTREAESRFKHRIWPRCDRAEHGVVGKSFNQLRHMLLDTAETSRWHDVENAECARAGYFHTCDSGPRT